MSTAVTTRYFDLDGANLALVAEQSYATGGGGADRYAGFDQFGRIIETLWKNGASTPMTLQNAKYGYNHASNRIWRENALTTGRDNNRFDILGIQNCEIARWSKEPDQIDLDLAITGGDPFKIGFPPFEENEWDKEDKDYYVIPGFFPANA